ncbi:DUF6313 family protein [Streptomyces albogriseolus]|uniref:DUF6313 family protein n=1 Tax=Streptomyces albogriseolus TaxID=1887 RepID=UPI0036FBA3E5
MAHGLHPAVRRRGRDPRVARRVRSVGRSAATSVPAYAYVLGLMGWLLVPAVIGGTAGYFVTRQIDRRRTVDAQELLDQMRRQAGHLADPPQVRE